MRNYVKLNTENIVTIEILTMNKILNALVWKSRKHISIHFYFFRLIREENKSKNCCFMQPKHRKQNQTLYTWLLYTANHNNRINNSHKWKQTFYTLNDQVIEMERRTIIMQKIQKIKSINKRAKKITERRNEKIIINNKAQRLCVEDRGE